MFDNYFHNSCVINNTLSFHEYLEFFSKTKTHFSIIVNSCKLVINNLNTVVTFVRVANMSMLQLQKQMQELQSKLTLAMEEQKYNATANNKVKLIISDKEFITNSRTLSKEQHGNTLFTQALAQVDEEGDDKDDGIIELCFDRNPDLFVYMLDYLRGYDLKPKLRQLKVYELETLRDDAIFYKIKGFQELIETELYGRFNPYLRSPLIEVKQNSRVATRSSKNVEHWHSAAICGTLTGTTSRYVEINIVTAISQYIMLGVTEADPFRISTYPGGTNFPGCSYHCYSGYLQRSNGSEPWGATSNNGDRVGALVKLNKESNMATIAFYKHGQI